MLSLIPSLVALGLAALAALLLATNRHSPPERESERTAAARSLALAVALQAIHFSEEAVTGFHDRLGALFGLPGMSFSFFVIFNVAWLVIWLVSIPGVKSGHTPAFFAAWFLSIAAVFNGVAHPLLALAGDGYFPGLWSSPVIAAAGAVLWIRLRRATDRSRPA